MNPELPEVVKLLDELDSHADFGARARLTLQLGSVEYNFDQDETEKLLESCDSVRKFHAALGHPEIDQTLLSMTGLEVSVGVADLLEELFNVE